MHPVLFKLGPVTIHTYGVLVALAFLAGITIASREAARKGIDKDLMVDLCLYLLGAAIIGSRLLEVAVDYRYYMQHPLEIVMIWKGGLVFYGGFILAVLTGVWFMNRYNMPLWTTADILAPCIALGQSIGRLGCFSAGCCYGKPTDLPWGVTFTDPGSLAELGVPLHPTQLYESAGTLVIFALLWLFRKKTKFSGQLFWMYVIMYSVLRFCLEFVRGDQVRGFVNIASFTLSTSQAVSIMAFLASVVMMARLKKTH